MSYISKAKILILTSTILCSNVVANNNRIDKIIIEGNKRIETSTVENYLKFNVGDIYDLRISDEAVKTLYATSMFENINIKFDNHKIYVQLTETAFISKISIKNNNKLKTSKIMNELLSMRGDSLSKAKLSLDVEKIKELYKLEGRLSTNVSYEVENLGSNKVYVTFNIEEGPKTKIKNINFVGNKYYKNHELQSIIVTKRSSIFSFLGSDDILNPAKIQYDKELLTQFYKSLGFLDFRVISVTSELNPTKEYFDVTYCIDEGIKYYLDNVTINNKLANIDISKIQKLITQYQGNYFNFNALEKIADNITNYFAKNGHSEVKATMNIVNAKTADKLVDVEFIIDKSSPVFIRRINIMNNLKTEDKVIRREFKIQEGDRYNNEYIEYADRSLRGLDYFEKVSLNVTPTEKQDQYDIDLEVSEKSTSAIGFDIGYNTASGLFGNLSFIETNLIGSGNILNAGVNIANKSTSYSFGVTNPYLFDKELSLGLNLFLNNIGRGGALNEQKQDYDIQSYGATTALAYNLSDNIRHSIEYTLKKDKNSSPLDKASIFIENEIGEFKTSSISHDLSYNKLDNRMLPKNGYSINVSQEYAGIGGDIKYLKHSVGTRGYISCLDNKLTFSANFRAGNIFGVDGQVTRASDHFNLGDYSLRGFESKGIGPRIKDTKEGIGGEIFYSLSFEATFPTGLPEEFNTSASIFLDIGTVYGVALKPSQESYRDSFYNDKKVRISTGIGFTWRTRLAPIRIDFPIRLKSTEYDLPTNFHIKFSTHL